MATETKAAARIRVLAGTFPAAHADQAKRLAAALREAKIEGFAVRTAANMPGERRAAVLSSDMPPNMAGGFQIEPKSNVLI